MTYYEALDEIEAVKSGLIGIDETREWIMEEINVDQWFRDYPRYVTGPILEVVSDGEKVLITGKKVGTYTLEVMAADWPDHVDFDH